MTPRVLARPSLPQLVPALVADSHLLILVADSAHLAWAADAAWAFARSAATGARTVLLVDLWTTGSPLGAGATHIPPRGIAEIFLTDAPLHDEAREQDRPRLFFIGRGEAAGSMVPVWENDRWGRLGRGFRAEGALLLLFAPAEALGPLARTAHGVVLLDRDARAAGTAGALPGADIMGIVVEEPIRRVSAPRVSRPAVRPPRRPARRPSNRFRLSVLVIGLALMAAAFAAWAGHGDGTGLSGARPDPAPPRFDAGDSLYYSVQVATFDALPRAMRHAEALRQRSLPAIVSPVRTGGEETWYRVLAGAVATPRSADSLRRDLWSRGALESPHGTIMRTPQAFRLGSARSPGDAENAARGLRARGVPAYIVEAPRSMAVLYVGAFDLPEQARSIDSLLTAAGITGTLALRVGTAR